MKTKQILSGRKYAVMFAAAVAGCMMLFSTTEVSAQVKIGTNPTTIGATNNLEVEASTAGNKVSIDKTTGKVTIADGSQGAAKVLTSDASGVATWQTPVSGTPTLPVQSKVVLSNYSYYPAASEMVFGTKVFDLSGNISGNTFVVPSDGLYSVKASIYMAPLGSSTPAGSPFNLYLRLYINGAPKDILSSPVVFAGSNNFLTGTAMLRLTAGDVLSIYSISGQAGGYLSCTGGDAVFVKLSE